MLLAAYWILVASAAVTIVSAFRDASPFFRNEGNWAGGRSILLNIASSVLITTGAMVAAQLA